MINRGLITWRMYMYVPVHDYDVLVIKICHFKITIYESLDEMKCFRISEWGERGGGGLHVGCRLEFFSLSVVG